MVCCIVLNWMGWRDTLACLETLKAQTAQPLHVIVVDNGSTDESEAKIREFIDGAAGTETTFQFVQSGANLGYGRGNNVGIRVALELEPDFVWLLNNDTEAPPDTLAKLVAEAERSPQAGMIGTVLYYHHNPAQVQAWSGGRVSRWLGTSSHFHSPAPQGPGCYVTFASALIRWQVLREVGLLYEGSFMYYEDSDYAMRMEATPWKIAVAADTALLHREGASTGESRKPFMDRQITVSGSRFLRRHSPAPVVSIPVFLLLKVLNRLRRRQWANVRAVLAAVPTVWRDSERKFRMTQKP